MAAGVHVQEPVLDTLRREDEFEKLMDQASNITLSNILVGGNIGVSHAAYIEPPGTLETGFEVKDSVEGNEGRSVIVEGEKFLKSPSAAEVHFEENNLVPDACQVTKNEEKATENETDMGEGGSDAEESNGLKKGLVSSLPADEAGLPEIKEDRDKPIPENEAAPMESLNANPEDTITCATARDTETTSSVEKKSMASTSQELPGDKKVEQTTLDTNQETPESISTIVPNEETEKNEGRVVDDSQMKIDEDYDKEDEKPEPTLIPQGKIMDDESMQNELFEAKNDTETVIQKCEEVVESSPEAASEAEDIKASTSDQIPTENPKNVVDKSECKPEKETPEEQVITKHEAHLEKESEKPCITDASTTDSSHDETTPVYKAKNEDQEPIKSDLFENKEDTESTIPVEEPFVEKHLESLNAAPDDIKASDLVQDTETKSPTKEEFLTATPLEIRGDKIERTSFDTKEELPEDVSTSVSNQETEENSIVEVPVVTEASTTDNELAVTEGKVKDGDQMEKDLLENNNDTGIGLLKQEVTENPVESLQLANEAEDTEVSTLDHDTKINALENKIITENPREIVADETDASITMETSHGQTTPVVKAKNEDDEAIISDSFEDKGDTESTILAEEPIVEKHWESLNAAPDDIIACDLVQDTETRSSTKEKLLTAIPQETRGDKIKQTSFDTHEETESVVEVQVVEEAAATENELAITDGKIKDEDQREKDLLENKNDTVSELLRQEVTEKPVESLQLANEAEDTNVCTSDHDTKISALENQILTENPREIAVDETESKPCDLVDAENETHDVQYVPTVESNDNNEENLLIEEDESEKTLPKLVESPQVEAEDIKSHVLDQETGTTGLILASAGKSTDGESAVKHEAETKDDDKKVDQLCDDEKNPESNAFMEASQIETPIEFLQETLPSTVPHGFLDDKTEEKTVGAIQKDREIPDVQGVTKTVTNDKFEENVLIKMDASQIRHEESSEQEHEIPSLIEASTKHANVDELTITNENTIQHEDLREVDLLESKKDTEINLQKNEEQTATHIEPLQVAARDIIALDSYQGTETINSQEERVPNKNEIMHEQTEDDRSDTSHTKKETTEALDVSTSVLNDDNEGNLVIGENDSEMNDEENLGKESEDPSFMEASLTDAFADESTKKCVDKIEGEEQTRAEDTESILLSEEETSAQPFESPQGDVEDIKTYSDQGTETGVLAEVFEGVAHDDEPEVKRTEVEDQKKFELCGIENIPDSALLLEAAQMEKPFEPTKVALPTLASQGFLDEKVEENATTMVSKENIEDDSLLQLDSSQIQRKKNSEQGSEITSISEASTKNINDDNSVNVHEYSSEHGDLIKHEFGDIKITSQKEEAQVETPAKSSNIAAEDIKTSDSSQETEAMSSQEKQTLKEEETVSEQIEFETLDTADTKTQTLDAHDVSTIVPNDDSGENSTAEENELLLKNEDAFGKETQKQSITEASMTDASGDDSANKCEDKVEAEEQMGAELFEGKKDGESKLLKEEETMVRLVESPHVDKKNIQMHVLGDDTETLCIEEAAEGDADIDESAVKHEVKTEDSEKKEDELSGNEKNPRSIELLETEQTEKPIESLQKTLPSMVPGGFQDDNTEEKTVDTIQKDEDLLNVTATVSNEKIEENPLIQMDGSQIPHKEHLEKEHEIPSVIEATTKQANDDELIVHEDNIEHENLRKGELLGSEKDTEINFQEEKAQIETHRKFSQAAAEDILVSDSSYQGTEATDSQEERILNANETVHEETEVEGLDAPDTKKENPYALEVSTSVLKDDNEENLVIGVDGSEVKDEENLEKESENSSFIESSPTDASGDESTKKCEDNMKDEEQARAEDSESILLKEEETAAQCIGDDDELISIHEDNIEHKDLRKVELLESKKDSEIETPLNSLQVAAEDTIPSDSYNGTETTSQEEKLLNEIVCEQTEVERLDTADSDKETPEAQNFATIIPSENKNSQILEHGSKLKQEELFEKESKEPPLSETLTKEAYDEVPEIIHQDQIEVEKLEIVDKFECGKHEEIVLLNEEAPAEKLKEEAKEDLENIKDIMSVASTTERSLIEVQSQNENQQEIVGNQMEENIVDKDPEKTEDEQFENNVMFKNETHRDIGFTKEEEPVRNFQESEKKELEEIKASVSHVGTETTGSIEEQDLTEISRERVGDPSEDKIPATAQEIPDSTPTVSGEHDENNSPIQPDGSHTKHEELSVKECETLPTPETSYLYSSSNQPTTIDIEGIENEHLNKAEKFEDEKHTKNAIISYQAPVEEPLLEEDKAFVSREGAETSSIEEQGLTKNSPEGVVDQLEEKILDKVGMTQEFTKSVSDENGVDIPLMPVYGSQIKHEELLEKESETSPLSETSLRNFNSNESTILHQDKIEDELLNRVDNFESEKHAGFCLLKEEAPLEKLKDLSLRKDLEEIMEFDLSEDTETISSRERNMTAIPQENDFTTVDASQIKHDEILERESKTAPMPLLHSSNENSLIVHTGKFEDGVLENADKFDRMESGKAFSLNEELLAEKFTESSKDLEGIKESTEITSSTEEPNPTTISGDIVVDQVEEKVLDAAGEASDLTAIVPDNNAERNLLVEVDASPIKHEEHLEKESAMLSLSMLNTSTEDPAIVHENEAMEHTEIILSNEALENSSIEESENIKASVLCEDTGISSIEQESLLAPDLTTMTSDENAEENSLIQLDGLPQIKHEEPLEKENETPSMSMLDIQSCVIDDQDLQEVDKFEHEKDTEATLLEEPTPAENVTKPVKDDLEDTKVFISCKEKEITSSTEEQSQKSNHHEIVVDQTQEDIFDSAQDLKQTVSHENAGENSLIQANESQVKQEILNDQTQENVLDTAPKDRDFKPAISHENTEENALIQVDELLTKHCELEKESETPSLLIVDTSNNESRIIHEDITEDENLNHDFECQKHEEIISKKEETEVTKVNESLNEDLEDIKALVSGEDSETGLESLTENPGEIFSDQLEEKILDIAPAAQLFTKVVSNENIEKDSMIQEDGSQMVHAEIAEKEGETPLSTALIPNTTSEDSTVIHNNKIENEDTREVDILECKKHVDGDILDVAPEAPESKVVGLDENTEEKSSNQVDDETQTKHEELLEKKSKTLSLPETSLLNTRNEDSTLNDDKIEDKDPGKVDKLECEQHTEFPFTKEEVPLQKFNNPLNEDLEETKAFVSCLDTETTSSMEDRSLPINPQDVTGENIIDATPVPQLQNVTPVSDENTKEKLSLDVDGSQIILELHENGSEKPSLSILKTEESSFIRDSKTENEDVKRDETVKQLNDSSPENIEVPVPSENLEITSSIEERSLTENPQETLTEDIVLDVVPEAQESKTTVPDKNIEENSFILEDGSQMKREENLEKKNKMPSLTETSILDDKNEDEDQAKVNKSECEKLAEITEVLLENPNSSNLENIDVSVSCKDIETTDSTAELSSILNPIENVGCENVEKVLDKAPEAPEFTSTLPDDNDDDNSMIQVDGSQMKHEEILEKESGVPSLLETSLLNTNNEEPATIHEDIIEEEALKSNKCSETNKLQEEAQVEESMAYREIKASVSYQDTEASNLQEQIPTAKPQDMLGNQSEDKVIDTADSKENITEHNLMVSNEKGVQDSSLQIESEVKHEENLEKESKVPYLTKTLTGEADEELRIIPEDMTEEESGKIVESTLLKEGSQVYESVESLQEASEDIKATVSCQNMDTTSSILNTDPQEIAGDQTEDNTNTAGTREINFEALNLPTRVSNENKVLESIAPQEELEIKHEEILQKERKVPFLTKTSMLVDNKESTIIHEDTTEGEDLKIVDIFGRAKQTEKGEAPLDETMESLEVASEHIKESISCQDTDPTGSFEEQILTTTAQEIVGDQVEQKVTDTAKTREKTPEVSSSVSAFHEDATSRTGADNVNSVMTKDEETLNRYTASNAAEKDEICASDNVQAKKEEKEIISKTKIDERADQDDTWIKLPEDETNQTYIEVREIDFSSHAEDNSEITQHDGAKDIPKDNENSTANNEFLEDGYPTTFIVSKDGEQIDKDIKAETPITETGAALSVLSIAGVQCGQEENESEDNKAMQTETSLAPEVQEHGSQHTKLHESYLSLSDVKDSELEMAQKQGTDNLQSGDDANADMKELDEGSDAIAGKENYLDANLSEITETKVTAEEKEASQDPGSEFIVREIQEPQKTVEAVPGVKNEHGEIKYDDSDDLKINSSTLVTDKVSASDILCHSTCDAGQRAVGQEAQIVEREKEQEPGKGKAIEAVPEGKGNYTEQDETKEDVFSVLKEHSSIVALDKVTPANILQGSNNDAALRSTDEETPQRGLDEASLKEMEAGPPCTTDKLRGLEADQIDDANFNSSVGSNKIPVLQHRDSSESSQAEGEKQETSEPEKGERCGNEETSKLMETSESTEMDKPSLSRLLQEPVKEVSKVVDHLIDIKEPTTHKEELQAEKSDKAEHVEAKTDEEKDCEEESGEHQISDLSSDTPVMVDAADRDVKVAQKKSHNILSGVGSKVKHSISKVRKAITGKSSHPKSGSPKSS